MPPALRTNSAGQVSRRVERGSVAKGHNTESGGEGAKAVARGRIGAKAAEAEPQRVRAITMVAVEGEHTAAVLKSLRGIPEVHALPHHQWPLGHCCRTRRGKPRGLRSGAATHPAYQGDFEFRDEPAVVDAQNLTQPENWKPSDAAAI
jgi:hypothetical protein